MSVCVCVIDRRIAEHLEQNLPNLDTLILTGNNIQELGDVDTLSSVTTLTTLRFELTTNIDMWIITTLRFELTTTRFHLLQTSHHTNIHQKNFVKSGTHQLKAIFAMNYIFLLPSRCSYAFLYNWKITCEIKMLNRLDPSGRFSKHFIWVNFISKICWHFRTCKNSSILRI